ncbi:hypothetical protein G6F22_017259 [Rhizopus arrhizus]|nr:hypothetical protein G6F22_017259 [Rhizopus arrhizus]
MLNASGDGALYPPSKYIYGAFSISQHAVGGSMVQFASEHLKARKIGYINHDDAYGGWNLEAAQAQAKQLGDLGLQVQSVNPNITDVTAPMLKIRAGNPDVLLLPGMYVRVQTRQGVDPEAILVPQRAVLRSTDGKPQVMVVGKDEIVESRLVQTGTMRGGDWHIVEGLNAGDRVIVGGVNAAVPGQKVSVTPAAEPKVAAAGKASASAAN